MTIEKVKYYGKHWLAMLRGNSVEHVNQDLGHAFSVGELKGYFNNMTDKVLLEPDLLYNNELPKTPTIDKGDIVFPVAVFQYALGLYDLYIIRKGSEYREKFLRLADWALSNQNEIGAWDNFSFIYPEYPYGAMCQGEAISLLTRAYVETNDERYINAAKKAFSFMVMPVDSGGTAKYEENGIIVFLEYTQFKEVLNGWIFALMGIYDLTLVCDDYKDYFDQAINSLASRIIDFDIGYWSKYDGNGRIASPFYHDLHIAQLSALCLIADDCKVFHDIKERWITYKNTPRFRHKAIAKKIYQKLIEVHK